MTTARSPGPRKLAAVGWVAVAGCLLWLGSTARGQVQGGATLPSGTRVGMGTGPANDDPADERRRMKERFDELTDQAQQHIEDEQWREAVDKLDLAGVLITDRDADVARLRELYQHLERHGRTLLAEADAAFRQQRYVEAMAGYEKIVHLLPDLPAAEEAYASLEAARADPSVRAFLAEQRAVKLSEDIDRIIAGPDDEGDPAAQSTGEPAENSEDAPPSRPVLIKALTLAQQVQIVELMEELESDYGRTPTGQAVTAELESLRADEAFMAAVDGARQDKQAEHTLKKAQLYERNGMSDKALVFYKEVVERYPDSEAAQTAREQILALEVELGR